MSSEGNHLFILKSPTSLWVVLLSVSLYFLHSPPLGTEAYHCGLCPLYVNGTLLLLSLFKYPNFLDFFFYGSACFLFLFVLFFFPINCTVYTDLWFAFSLLVWNLMVMWISPFSTHQSLILAFQSLR